MHDMDDRPGGQLLFRVYGDSLSLPRAPDCIGHRDTYPELVLDGIRHRFPSLTLSLYNRSGGGMTIDALHERYLHDCSYFGDLARQVLLIQCGIVDCAPRPIPAVLRNLIGRLPGPIRAPITGFLHRARPHLLRAGLSWRLTAPSHFANVLTRWLAHAAGTFERVYVLTIAPTVPEIASHSPGLSDSIAMYNNLIREVSAAAAAGSVVLVDICSAISKAEAVALYVNAADGHHITREGHALYSELILAHELVSLNGSSGPGDA
jgi:hypothetical protein